MNYAAILHRPMSEFAFAVDETHYVFRLRAQRNDLTDCLFYYADRASMAPELRFQSVPMSLKRRDSLYDWFEVSLAIAFPRIAYYFELSDGQTSCALLGDCFESGEFASRSDYFQLPFNHRADRLAVPDWTHDAVVYNIFPDSFASGRRLLSGRGKEADHLGTLCRSKLGGTLNGVRDNLDYLCELGFNCIYLNPIFTACSYHKYDLLDYFHVDPCFGTDEDFRDLVRAVHAKGMRILIDGVFNHVSSNHFTFQSVLKEGTASPYFGWFYHLPEHPSLPTKGEQPDYTCFSYVWQMPKTDTSDPDARHYFCDVGAYWVREFDVDGWRLDVGNEMDDGFLRAFRQRVKQVKPDALIIGEVWENAAHFLNGDMFDSAMNYDFRRFCGQFFADGTLDAQGFDLRVSQLLMRYRAQALPAQLNLLDSHDVSRFLSRCNGETDRFELAVLFQMTFIGMPCVFYGDEKGIVGVAEDEYRIGMPWDKQSPLETLYRRLIALRRAHKALMRGDFATLSAQGALYAYRRAYEEDCVTVAMNVGDSPVKLEAHGLIAAEKGWREGVLAPRGYVVLEG